MSEQYPLRFFGGFFRSTTNQEVAGSISFFSANFFCTFQVVHEIFERVASFSPSLWARFLSLFCSTTPAQKKKKTTLKTTLYEPRTHHIVTTLCHLNEIQSKFIKCRGTKNIFMQVEKKEVLLLLVVCNMH
jgi:hypothetical protein